MASNKKPNINSLLTTAFATAMAGGIMVPVLPALVTQMGGNSVSNASFSFGMLMTAYALAQFIAAPILGMLSDRFGRRPIILLSLLGSALDYLLMSFAPTITWLLIGRLVSGGTAGIVIAVNAYVTDVVEKEDRAVAFGKVGAALSAGIVVGPAIGGVLGDINLRLPFVVASACLFINLIYTHYALGESLGEESRRELNWGNANPLKAVLSLRLFPRTFPLAMVFFLYWCGCVMMFSTWILYTLNRFSFSQKQVGLSLVLMGITGALVQAKLTGPITRRMGEWRSALWGLLISAITLAGYGVSTNEWMFFLVIVAGSIGNIARPTVQALITREVPASQQGTVQGGIAALTGLAGILIPPISSYIFAASLSPSAYIPGLTFFAAATVTAVAGVTLTKFRPALAPQPGLLTS